MSDFDQGTSVRSDDALEQLLKHASPRPMPSRSDEAAVRQAVRNEWLNISTRHRSRRRVVNFAIAATVLVGVFSVFSVFRTPVVEVVQVASIEESFGSIYLLGEEAVLRKTQNLSGVLSGQTIVTDKEAGIALAWGNGGSLRVDENTRVEFTTDESVYVKHGRIYFDSKPSALIAGTSATTTKEFVVHTDLGEVEHVGTQFMTDVEADTLTVSVREGKVSVDGAYQNPVVAYSGEQIKLAGRQQPSLLSISRYGDSWDWVNRSSRSADVDGKTINEFLVWVCRELGYELKYEGQAAQIAGTKTVIGDYKSEPMEILRMAMRTTALEYRVDETEGVIYVSD